MQEIKLLNGAEEFWADLRSAISVARQRVLVQAMTFEADEVGRAVEEAILQSQADQRRVLADAYSLHVINDRLVGAPWNWRNTALQQEARETRAMFLRLEANGIGVRITNPVGLLMHRYPARNHKKLMVVDDSIWLGGINFSQHNFGWHDFMIRITCRDMADFLSEDFSRTFSGSPEAKHQSFGNVELLVLDGLTNAAAFNRIRHLILQASSTVAVLSPYLTEPVTGWLAEAAGRGVNVEVYTPQANNKPIMTYYLHAAMRNTSCRINAVPGMSHAKCIVIDDDTIIIGSSNFDFVSLQVEEEVIAVIRDHALCKEVRNRVFPKLKDIVNSPSPMMPKLVSLSAKVAVHVAARALCIFRPSQRSAVPPPQLLQ